MTRRDGPLGVAVVGLGVGEQHARKLASNPACRLVALNDIDISRAEVLAQCFAGCRVAETYEDVLGSAKVDLVVIASFDDAHAQQVIGALEAGKHVFVEKPLCCTLDELRSIRRVWAATGGALRLRSNLVLRAAPLYGWLRQEMQRGSLGKVFAFDGDYLYGRLHKITEGWRKDQEGYSVIEGGGIHLIDLMLWLTNQRPLWAEAVGNRIATEGSAFRYKDYVAATLGFESGLVARITANFGCVHRHQHVLRIFGTEGTFIYDDAGARLHNSRDPAVMPRLIVEAPLPLNKGDLTPSLVDAIVAATDDRSETQSYFDGVSICLAIDKALSTGARESIEYV